MIDQKKIGIRIQECRKQQRMTVEHLAELANISPEFLRAIESGQKGMSLTTLANLAVSLQTSTDYLLFGSASEEKYTVMVQILQSFPEERIHDLARLLKNILELSHTIDS
ncbi:MAG: helix-turn-helix domain-containing protein [Lachnospiraceae bacterium]|nr:helix-turn-helix domain-containing protein [Lachnospiraceae bacterium]